MEKKKKVTKYLSDIESLAHKMIDEKRDKGLTSFELIMLIIDTSLKEYMILKRSLNELDDSKYGGNC